MTCTTHALTRHTARHPSQAAANFPYRLPQGLQTPANRSSYGYASEASQVAYDNTPDGTTKVRRGRMPLFAGLKEDLKLRMMPARYVFRVPEC